MFINENKRVSLQFSVQNQYQSWIATHKYRLVIIIIRLFFIAFVKSLNFDL